jgi:parvulin-like peptidyl-prolyl isomerase
VAEFERAALELSKPGEISPVVHTKFGYHVIALVSREESRQRSFEQVKEPLSKQLARSRHCVINRIISTGCAACPSRPTRKRLAC